MKGAITAMKNIDYNGYLGPRMSRERMLKRLEYAMETELNENQRRIVRGYYVEHRTIPEMAKEKGVNKSTVCRTLRRAEAKLRRILRY